MSKISVRKQARLHLKKSVSYQRGAVMILFINLLVSLVSIAALTIDAGRLFVVHKELQNAADAAALAGANKLFPTNSGVQWNLAQTTALDAIALNQANSQALSTGTVSVGYYDLTGGVEGVRTINSPGEPGINDRPIVQVTIPLSEDQNGGPFSLLVGRVIGLDSMDLSSTSRAVAGGPMQVGVGMVFPMAISLSVFNSYWDSANHKPAMDPVTGQAYQFTISSNHNNGQWTSFNSNNNGIGHIKALIDTGNPLALAVGESIWIHPGMGTSVYKEANEGTNVLIPIVADTTLHQNQPIIAFGALHIDEVGHKALVVHLINNYKVNYGTAGGRYYGAYTSPGISR